MCVCVSSECVSVVSVCVSSECVCVCVCVCVCQVCSGFRGVGRLLKLFVLFVKNKQENYKHWTSFSIIFLSVFLNILLRTSKDQLKKISPPDL